MYRDPQTARLLGYRARRRHCPGHFSDIFDGSLYRELLGHRVRVNGKTLDNTYFSSPTDIALGLSTDGFGPFKSRSHQCWPLLLFNYNLDPQIRMRLENLLCVGVIPGPNGPKEIDTFLDPLIKELEELASGVPAFDGANTRPFCLRAHLIACFGDMPAVAKIMCMKGHRGKLPCRACKIVGIQPQGGNTYYIPLSRPFAARNEGLRLYDPRNLPKRTHAEFLRDAIKVESANMSAEEQRCGRDTGINGLSSLATLASLRFPHSFPHDFMHLMFENIIKTLLDLWTHSRDYEKFGTGEEPYILDKTVWAAIGEACTKSGDTVPSRFGSRIPNIEKKRSEMTSESIMLFTTLLAPGLLLHQFDDNTYYRHFIDLVRLINKCMALELTGQDVDDICEGFAKWVQKHEEIYYGKACDRLRACTVPLHALLHVADDIDHMGPVWAYWAFAMERYCGFLAQANKSCRYPYASLNRWVLQLAQLAQIKLLYGLREELDIRPNRLSGISGNEYIGYPNLVFGNPRRVEQLSASDSRKVTSYVGAFLQVDPPIMKRAFEGRKFVSWGRMQKREDRSFGDLIWAAKIAKGSEQALDASFVKFQSILSLYDWNCGGVRVTREVNSSYGQVKRFIVVHTKALQKVYEAAELPIPHLQPIIVAIVTSIPHLRIVRNHGMELVQYKLLAGKLAMLEIIDVCDINCVIGRFSTSGTPCSSYIVDCEMVVGQIDVLNEMIDPNDWDVAHE